MDTLGGSDTVENQPRILMACRARRGARLLAVVTAVAMMAMACGDDDGSGAQQSAPPTSSAGTATSLASTTTAVANDVDPEGVLRLNMDLVSNGGPDLDPTKIRVSPFTAIQLVVYDSLFRVELDGTFTPSLATSAEVVDPQTITVELREGLTFTDGTPLDAAAAEFSIERNRDAENVTLSAELQEIEDVTVDGPLTFTIHLKTPIAGAVYDRLPYGDFALVSPTAVRNGVDLSTNPVGAGPFMLDALEPGRRYAYVKNPDYWDADNIRLAGVEFLHIEPGQAVVNAIQSGAIDLVAEHHFSYEQSKAIGASGWQVDTEVTDNIFLWGHACKSRPPFDDVRVRQALNYAIDRDAINAAVYDGKGEPMWGFFSSSSPYYNPDLEGYYDYDPARARQLLSEAGQPNLTFDAFYTAGSTQRAAEIMQAQMAEAGITMNLLPLTNTSDFYPDPKAPIWITILERSGIQKVARVLVPGSIGNICTWNDPDLNALVAEIKAVQPEDPRAAQLWADLQELALERAMNLFTVFGVRATAYDPDRVGNPRFLLNFQGKPFVDFYDVYVKE